MKSLSDDNNGSSQSNWLGFSLSPHLKADVASSSSSSSSSPSSSSHPYHHHHHHHHQYQPSNGAFFLSHRQLNNSGGLSYGVAENSDFHSALSVMPLKSDGSLCIMEALTRSQQQAMATSSPPKLEDFLGGATTMQSTSMALSLDSMYYHQNTDQDTNSEHCYLNQYYNRLTGQGMFQSHVEDEQKAIHLPDCDSNMPPINWVSRYHHQYPNQNQNEMVHQLASSSLVEDDCGGSGLGSGELQSLRLSMSPGSQSSCVAVPRQISPNGTESIVVGETKKRGPGKMGQKLPVHRKSIDTFGQRTSQYRGVTRHRWTGRYEAHLWDNSCKKEGQTRKGRQVYLGGYDMEEKAARAYDLAALKYWGPSTHINSPLANYQAELEEMKKMSRQEYVAHLRRKSSGFSRGASMYRGVTRHHQHGRWQARIGRVAGNKDLYLGTFSTQEEAAEAYDIAAIKFRGVNAVTNFDITRYDIERIMASNTLLAGELARRTNVAQPIHEAIEYNQSNQNDGKEVQQPESKFGSLSDWKMVLYQNSQQQPSTCVESVDHKTMDLTNYGNSSFSMSLHDMMGMDSTNPSQQMENESVKLGTHFSNPSSLVTSLSSSREESPDKTGPSMLFTKPPLASKFISPSISASSLLSSVQMRPNAAVPIAHMPFFAAWNDT